MATAPYLSRTMSLADLGADVPDWATSLVTQLNLISTAVQDLATGLTFGDNFQYKPITVAVNHGVAISIGVPGVVGGFVVLNSVGTDGAARAILAASIYGSSKPGQANLIVFFADSTATNVKVTLLLTREGYAASKAPAVAAALGVVADPPLAGAGTAASHLTIPDAGAAQDGTVSTGTQTFGGNKTFAGSIVMQTASSGGFTQEPWTIFSYSGTWGSAGAGPTPGFFKDTLGIVHLRGLVTGGGAATIAVLPSGYRPSSNSLRFFADNNGAYGRVDIDSSGNLMANVGGFVNRSLDGITFDTR